MGKTRLLEACLAQGQAGLARDLTEVLECFNQGGADTLVVPSEYLEVVATRR